MWIERLPGYSYKNKDTKEPASEWLGVKSHPLACGTKLMLTCRIRLTGVVVPGKVGRMTMK